jgi:hypothetical protein
VIRQLFRLWRNDADSRKIRRSYVATMGPVFAAAAIVFAIEGAAFPAVVAGLAALFAVWQFVALR